MKKKKIKRVSVLALSLVMALSLTSLPVYAAEMESGDASLTVNSSKVAFAGYEWWVIGDDEEGVYPLKGHITLLSANNKFGYTAFRNYEGGSYASNPEGLDVWATVNEYAGSTLQQKMEEIAEDFPDKEQNVIAARNLTSSDGIYGQGISGQKLWALSEAEWNTIYGNGEGEEVLSYGASWWLRSPYYYSGNLAQLGDEDGDGTDYDYVDYGIYVARPAFSLNLESVLFTSAASDSGKSTTVGSSLTSMGTIDEYSTVKFTMKDSSQTLTVNATTSQSTQSGNTLYFTYSNATTGTNQNVSCVLVDEDGNVAYYAKLADSSNAASGNLSISLAGVEEGTYTLQIFSEEANDYLYTDFCSEPVTMTVTVSGGIGTVSEFGGNVLSTGTTTEDTTSDEVTNPQTADYILLITLALLVSGGAAVFVGRKLVKERM